MLHEVKRVFRRLGRDGSLALRLTPMPNVSLMIVFKLLQGGSMDTPGNRDVNAQQLLVMKSSVFTSAVLWNGQARSTTPSKQSTELWSPFDT